MKTQNRYSRHVLIAAVLTFALAMLSLTAFFPLPAFAIDPRPIPEPIDPPDVIDPLFKAPANGFDWKMAPRFGSDRDGDHVIDYHWDEASATYDPDHVRPSQFAVFFRGCPDKDENRHSPNGVNSYKWEFLTTDGSTILLGNSHDCRPLFSLPPQGVVEPTPWDASYRIKLTITAPDNQSQTFENIVHVRDFLIVSIGDSYGSGEGNPDVPQVLGGTGPGGERVVTEPAKWEDSRCHRSAFAGPAQAALAIEGTDPQTSVTFLSFACSGATIHTDFFDGAPTSDPYAGDSNKPGGSGVLGSYIGAQPLVYPPHYTPDYMNHLPPQIQQVANAVGDRPIDALIISIGGNDAGFGPIAVVCLLNGWCQRATVSAGNNFPISLESRVEGDLYAMIGKYDQLAACIQSTDQDCVLDLNDNSQVTVPPLGVDPAHVYITEYPDGTRNDSGEACDDMLEDVIGVIGFTVDHNETEWISNSFVGFSNPAYRRGLNGVLSAAAERFGWNLVDGISSQFAGTNYGHGYCAHNNWVRRAREAALLQGPPDPNPNAPGIIVVDGAGFTTRAKTKGTLHPTAEGHQAYSRVLVPRLKAGLYGSGSEPAQGPTYSSSDSDDTAQSDEGTNGWLIGRCPTSGSCVSDYAVLTVETSDPSGILGASLSIDGTPGCTTADVTCNSAALVDPQTYRWSFHVAEGMHRLDFSVRSLDGQVATFSREVKVDLNAPTASATLAPASSATGGWYRTPVTVTFQGTDGASGSGVAGIDYWLDGATSSVRVGVGETLEIKTVGTHTIQYQAVDWAGHTGAMQTLTFEVHYNFQGFFAPVDNKDASGNFILNTVKAGSAIPVKFSLGGNQGLNVLASGTANPKSENVSCTNSGPEDGIEETVSASGSGLSYDASANQYIYVWKTDKSWSYTCRLLTVTLGDGTLHQAKFKFTK